MIGPRSGSSETDAGGSLPDLFGIVRNLLLVEENTCHCVASTSHQLGLYPGATPRIFYLNLGQ